MMNLVDTQTSGQLRSAVIDTEFPDPAALQAELVSKASEMLDISLAPSAIVALQAGNTQVPSAYRYYVEGRGYLQRFDNVAHLEKAMSLFRNAIQLDSRYALAYSGLAEASLDRWNATRDPRSLDDAVMSASRAVDLNGGLTEVHVTMGRALSEKGQYEDAEREFQRSLKIDPRNAEALRRLAHLYEDTGRRQNARKIYEDAIRLRPNDWRGYQFLGGYYVHNGKYPEAAQYYRRVLDLTPDNYNAYSDLGVAYLGMGNYPEAAAQLEKSVSLKPVALNCSNLGSVYYLQGKYKEAARWYEKAVSFVSTDSSWWGNLADAYRWAPELSSKAPGAYAKAISLGQRQLALNERNSKLRSRLAYYYSATGDKDAALREIQEALRESRDDGYVLFRAAGVYEQLHNRNAALDAIQAALRAGYSSEVIRKAPVLKSLREDPRYQAFTRIQ